MDSDSDTEVITQAASDDDIKSFTDLVSASIFTAEDQSNVTNNVYRA